MLIQMPALRLIYNAIYNSLPLRIRETQPLPAFKRRLKTHSLQSAYPTPWRPTIQRAMIF